MSAEAKASFAGLFTDIAETVAPPSALREAENVCVRSPGMCEPRQSFPPFTTPFSVSGLNLSAAHTHGSGLLLLHNSALWYGSAGDRQVADQYFSRMNPTQLRADCFGLVNARKNAYFPHANGVGVSQSTTDANWLSAGLPAIASFYNGNVSTLYGSKLPNMYKWAYRAVAVRRDANGVEVRSAPSVAYVIRNVTGAAGGVGVALGYMRPLDGAATITRYEVYRSRAFPLGVEVDDELQLVATLEGPGPHSLLDDVDDVDRGATIYTAPSQGGIFQSNQPPPAAAVGELYKNCVFYGDVVGPQRFTVSFDHSTVTGSATGVGKRVGTCDTTAASVTVLNVNPTAGLQQGQLFMLGGLLDPERRIQSIVGTTVTLTKAAVGTVVGASYEAYDAIEVNGRWMPLYGGQQLEIVYSWDLAQAVLAGGYRELVFGIYPPAANKMHTIVIESFLRNQSSFTVRATHGDEFVPPLGLAGGTALNSSADVYPNGLVWSKPEEPEHFPLLNFQPVGEQTKRIIGLKATRDSLFIFKEDGIWRLYGTNGQWRIDAIDLTTFCVLPSSIQRLNNRIYMLSNKGIVEVSDEGVFIISAPVNSLVRPLVTSAREHNATNGYYKLSGIDGVASAVDDRNSEYHLLIEGASGASGGRVLVFNQMTGAWYTYRFKSGGFSGISVRGLGVHPDGAPLLLGTGVVHKASYSTLSINGATVPTSHDGSAALTINSTGAGSTSTRTLLTFSGSHGLVTGDVIAQGSAAWSVVAVPTGTTAEVLRSTGDTAPANGACTAYRAIQCTVQPHGFYSPADPVKNWIDSAFAFSRFLGPVRLEALFSSAELGLVESAQQVAEDVSIVRASSGMANAHLGNRYRHIIPNDHRRSWLLRVGARWSAHAQISSLEAITAMAREGSAHRQQVNG